MEFDFVLPTILFGVTLMVILFYERTEGKFKKILEERKMRVRDVILFVSLMAITVSLGVIIPSFAIMAFFLLFFSLALFTATYFFISKWYLAVFTPAVYLLGYYLLRDVPLIPQPPNLPNPFLILYIDVFATLFVIFISIYLGSLFTWKTTALFVGLIMIVDVFQVFITGHMQETAQKMVDLKLPVMMVLPTYPIEGLFGLGLGDFFFSGLLSIQTLKIFGRKTSIISAASIALVFGLFEAAQFHYQIQAMPATVSIICGWLAGIGVTRLGKKM